MKYFLLLALFFTSSSYAWDGYDSNGHSVEIEKGNLVREGEDVEVYDYTDGEYKNVMIDNIYSSGSTVEIEAYDYDTGDYITYEMDD